MKKTWKKVRPLIDLGDHLGVTLSNGAVALIDFSDRSVAERWNWTANQSRNGIYGHRVDTITGHISLHQAILGTFGDHRDGNTLDCRRSNLRAATFAQNCRNRRVSSANTSGFKGVSFRSDRSTWLAGITKDGRYTKIGTFGTAIEAAAAYDRAASEMFGEFAFLNFPGAEQ